jgi:hypothetical protein
MLDSLATLDRRWIFLAMGLSVAIPVLFQVEVPESPSQLSQAVFDEIENLSPGDRVLLAWDYDPSTAGELEPMATCFAYHCARKGLKLYFITLLPVGPQMIDESIDRVIKQDFPELVYGEDYVNLGFKSGNEGVVKVIVTDLRKLYTTDHRGTNIDQIPMCKDVESIQQMKLIANVSGAYPGTKEWVQYASTPYPLIRCVAGCTGVQAPLLYPYIPNQLNGLLGAIKGAAEYEALVSAAYLGDDPPAQYKEARRRMGPQLVAHLLMILLIIAGNVIYFRQRRAGTA